MSLQKLVTSFGFNVDAKSVDAAINSVNSIDREVGRVSRGMTKFMGLLGAGGIGAGIYTFAKDAVQAFAEEEKSINQLSNALANLGITNRAVTQDLVEFAKAQARVSMATDEEIIAAERSLVQRGLWGDALKQAIRDSLDLRTKTGDLASAADILGKAFQGQTKGLNLLGIQIDESLPKAQIFAEVHKQIQARFSGAAAAEMKGYSGQVHLLGLEWDDLVKTWGERLTPAATLVVTALTKVTRALSVLGPETKEHRVKALEEMLERIQVHLKKLESPKSGFFDWLDRSPAAINLAKKDIHSLMVQIDLLKAKMGQGGGGTTTPPGDTTPENTQINMPKQAGEIDTATVAWLRNNRAMQDYYTAWAGHSATFVSAIRPTEELRARVNTETWKQIERNWKDAEQKNKATVEEMQVAWEEGSQSISGGLQQALIVMHEKTENFRDNWLKVIGGSVGPAKAAFHDFFTSSSKDFLNLEALAKKVFNGILKAFLDMAEEMLAKAAVYGIFSMFSNKGGGLLKFLGFSQGGYTGDGDPNEVAGVVHRGEFVLDADTTSNLMKGRPAPSLAPAFAGASAAGGGGGSVINNFYISGIVDSVDALCDRISESARQGDRAAGELSNVVSKVGGMKAGNTAL